VHAEHQIRHLYWTVVALLVLGACATPCVLRGGARLYAVSKTPGEVLPEWTCAGLQGEWDASINALAQVTADLRLQPGHLSHNLAGWQVVLHPTYDFSINGKTGHGYWLQPNEDFVVGHTDCWQKRVHFGAGLPLRQSAVIHELAHVFQACNPKTGTPQPDENEFHLGWHDIGLYRVIESHNNSVSKP
jgi:hypothetical protein